MPDQAGPFQFYPTQRACPQCGQPMVGQEPLSFGATAKIIHMLGMPCYCMPCSGRYRASPKPWMRFLPWMAGLAMVPAYLLIGVIALRVFRGMPLLLGFLAGVGAAMIVGLIPLCRWIWWQIVPLKKIFTYQDELPIV